MQNNSIKLIAAGAIAAVLAVVGYTMLQSGAVQVPKKVVDPTGQILFLAQEAESLRNYPQTYDVLTGEFQSVENNPDTFYIQALADGTNASLQAPYFKRDDDDLYYPYTGSPSIVQGDAEVELSDIINPSQLSWSPQAEKFVFHALSRKYTNSTEPDEYYASENYLDSYNWAIYSADVNSGEVTELAAGHSPVWSPDGRYILFLTVQGVSLYEVSTGMSWSMAELPERLPTPASSLALSSDGNKLYVLTTAYAVSPDKLFVLDVQSLAAADLSETVFSVQKNMDLPEGNHFDFALSPDDNYAVVTTYGEDSFALHTLNLQTEQIIKDTLFEQSGLEKYYHFPNVSWSNLSPAEFD
jgi:Tol biopolymer transport system component